VDKGEKKRKKKRGSYAIAKRGSAVTLQDKKKELMTRATKKKEKERRHRIQSRLHGRPFLLQRDRSMKREEKQVRTCQKKGGGKEMRKGKVFIPSGRDPPKRKGLADLLVGRKKTERLRRGHARIKRGEKGKKEERSTHVAAYKADEPSPPRGPQKREMKKKIGPPKEDAEERKKKERKKARRMTMICGDCKERAAPRRHTTVLCPRGGGEKKKKRKAVRMTTPGKRRKEGPEEVGYRVRMEVDKRGSSGSHSTR